VLKSRYNKIAHEVPKQIKQIEDSLSNIYLLARLDEKQLELIKQSMYVINLDDGEYLFEYKQQAKRFFVIVNGHVKLFRSSINGMEKVIEVMGPRESFAEAIMFMQVHVYPVTAQAIGETMILSFENKVFLSILEESFGTCCRVMSDMSRRLHKWVNEIDRLTLQNATIRLINYLVSHITEPINNTAKVEFTVPKHIIASRLSIKPETLSRILHNLSKQKLINVDGKIIHINDINSLEYYEQ
jgi:CRP-like cAMP-binding protein